MAALSPEADPDRTNEQKNESTSPACCHAHVKYSFGQGELKGEDVHLVEFERPWPGSDPSSSSFDVLGTIDSDSALSSGSRWLSQEYPPHCRSCGACTSRYSIFCVFDGHNGVHAAKMAGEAVIPILEARLPLGCPPQWDHGVELGAADAAVFATFREGIQLALVETTVELNRLFAQRGIHAGCTATLVLQIGWLVTTANLGDSRVVLDTGVESVPLTVDHRVASHKAERHRVEAMGAIVAPLAMWGSGPADDYASGVGPLRIWPGGLSISRAIGDFDVGDSVLPFPHLTQLIIPPTGGRLLVASDGVWDAFDKMARAGSMTRTWPLETVPSRMIQTIVRAFGGLKDDTTLIAVDILPPGFTFPQAVAVARKGKSGTSSVNGSVHGGAKVGDSPAGGGCFCFGGSAPPEKNTRPSPTSVLDASVRSASSSLGLSPGPSMRNGGKYRTEMLLAVDVAAIMGLMPDPGFFVPGWYSPEIGERLFQSASDASDTWQAVHAKRYARPPATVSMPATDRPRRGKDRRKVAFSEELEKATAASAPRRVASEQFSGALAESGEDFAAKFGHYKALAKDSRMMEPSVRAGRIYNTEASMHGGNAMTQSDDPSVRLRGSDFEGSVHVKASKLRGDEAVTKAATMKKDALPPVRIVKRTGSAGLSRAVDPPPGESPSYKTDMNDSAKEMLRPRYMGTIGE